MFWSTRAFIRDLDDLFSDLRAQSGLLHRIDQLILDPDIKIDAKLRLAVSRFSEILGTRGWAVIFPDGVRFHAFFGEDRYLLDRKEKFLSGLAADIARMSADHAKRVGEGARAEVIARPDIVDVTLADDADGHATVLLVPVSGGKSEPFCYLAPVIAGLRRTLTGLETEEVFGFAIQVSTQLSILIQHSQETVISSFQLALNGIYFQSDSGWLDALSAVMESVSKLLPDWEPFTIHPPAVVQLLAFRELTKPLQMLAAGGGERNHKNGAALWQSLVGKPVPIDSSVCGLYLKSVFPTQITKEAWVTNPAKDHPKLFKSFQGATIPESEMVVPLLRDGKPIGVLNFEHNSANAFSRYHRDMAQRVSTALVPFLTQTHQLEIRIKERERLLLATVDNLTKRIKKTAEHKTKGHLAAALGNINRIKRRFKEDSDLHETLDQLYASSKDVDDYLTSYIGGIPDYLHSGEVEIQSTLRAAIGYFHPKSEQLSDETDTYFIEEDGGQSANIEIRWLGNASQVDVFASQMLQDHLYSLLKNSLEAIGERRKSKRRAGPGHIAIEVALKEMTDDLNEPIPGQRVVITVSDNGTGVPDNKLQEIFQYGDSTKRENGGWGYGLPAATDYLRSFGGDLFGHNKSDGDGFEVVLFLDEYDPRRHADSTIVGF